MVQQKALIAALYIGSSLTDSLTHSLTGAELGQSFATQVKPHGNFMTPLGYLIGPHGSITALS